MDLEDYVRSLCENFKRSHQLRDILTETWLISEPNASTTSGNTLLHISAKLQEVKLVNILCQNFINHGLHLDAVNFDGNTALHLTSNSNIAEILLKNGSQGLDMKNNHNLVPVQISALKCNISCLEIFMKSPETDDLILISSVS